MEAETGNLASKVLNGGVWGALGVFFTAAFNYWQAKKKDDSQNTFATLGAINKGSEVLMNSLLQSQKQLTEELRATRHDLAATDLKLDQCEQKHREGEARIAELERKLGRRTVTRQDAPVQPVANTEAAPKPTGE